MAKKSSDEAVMDLLKKVQQKKEEIKNATKKPVWLTTCTIGYNPDASANDRVNIMTIKDPSKLVDLYSFLLSKQSFGNQAITALKLTQELTYMGYPVNSWMRDLETRAEQLVLEEKKRELDVLDKRVNSLVSQEQRREMELEALTAVLGE